MRPHVHHSPQPKSILFTYVLGITIGVIGARLFYRVPARKPFAPPPPPLDPSYKVWQPQKCDRPPRIRERPSPFQLGCISLGKASSHTLTLRIVPPNVPRRHYTLHLTIPKCSSHPPVASLLITQPVPTNHTTGTVVAFIEGLQPDTDYTAELREHQGEGASKPSPLACRIAVTTLHSEYNRISNPSFEEVANPPFLATRFRRAEDDSPRQWTPFYNGVARRVCGVMALSPSQFVYPRSGQCSLQLGPRGNWPMGSHRLFHGVHQAVPFLPPGVRVVLVSAWYRVSPGLEGVSSDSQQSPEDALSMILSWRLDDDSDDDGLIVPLADGGPASKDWTRVCAVITAPLKKRLKVLHIYFHMHDVKAGNLFVDDVSVRVKDADWSPEGHESSHCYSDHYSETRPRQRPEWKDGRTRSENGAARSAGANLCAEVRPAEHQLTIAVPMTANRVLRLESMSRQYAGGPIVAAVLVQSKEDMEFFCRIWWGKEWLRRHVDVIFVRRMGGKKDSAALDINALRNIAVRGAKTTFVMMADVDMTPATNSFACFRDRAGSWLRYLLPQGTKRVLTVPVFVADVHHRTPSGKSELVNLILRRSGTSYCLNSQRSNKVKRWYSEYEAIEIRFTTDFEPYGIVRRDEYPQYDERFSGYGFNKISWAHWAELGGWRLLLLPEGFITHLNHVENDWVQSIDVPHYLKTWRRFLAFAAECGRTSIVASMLASKAVDLCNAPTEIT